MIQSLLRDVVTNVLIETTRGAAAAFNENQGSTSQILGLEVYSEMKKYENNLARNANDSDCIALYGHWFLSILALVETLLRLSIHGILAILCSISYYLIFCFACGKTRSLDSLYSFGQFHFTMSYIYIGYICLVINNIVIPWNPPFFAFAPDTTLIHPPGVQGQDDIERAITTVVGISCCTLCHPSMSKSTKFLLISYGGPSVAQMSCIWGNACDSPEQYCPSYDSTLNVYQTNLRREREERTREFYLQRYQVDSFDALLASRLYSVNRTAPVVVTAHNASIPVVTAQIIH
eukprot:gene7062-14367_t